MSEFDVIVVGSGHAGVEAALASARLGARTLMVSMSADQIGTMSCNPAIGGLGKSQIAKEIDLLGGAMCRVADASAMQYRVLNEKKGLAVRATRVQVDRHEYRARMKWLVENTENLRLFQAHITSLLLEGRRVVGVVTHLGQKIRSRSVVLTTGTFMNGRAHVGRQSFDSGRAGEPASRGLSEFLKSEGVSLGRFKTGTVPRVDARSIRFEELELQESTPQSEPLSYFVDKKREDLVPAHLCFTNPATHEIIRGALEDSPLYSGIIQSSGPRYCPSVEDKIVRFGDKDRHQVFVEREGRQTHEVYVGGLSTSLPLEAQLRFLRSIKGLEQVEIVRPGYAIEYDYIDSVQLWPTLGLKDIPGLYFAGQVNGTSGYEEAAAQGLVAGINAAAEVLDLPQFTLSRSEAYTGVLIDDLCRKGTLEPYRMLSSRAEWRLLLREDNTDVRLFEKARQWKLLSDEELKRVESQIEARLRLRSKLNEASRRQPLNEALAQLKWAALKSGQPLEDVFKRPEFQEEHIRSVFPELVHEFEAGVWRDLMAELKYEGYIKQAQSQIRQMQRLEEMVFPEGFEFAEVPGLSNEAREQLKRFRPKSLAQASRLSGVSQASLSILAIQLSKIKKANAGDDACASKRSSA